MRGRHFRTSTDQLPERLRSPEPPRRASDSRVPRKTEVAAARPRAPRRCRAGKPAWSSQVALQHAVLHYRPAVERHAAVAKRQVEVAERMASRDFVCTRGVKEVAG